MIGRDRRAEYEWCKNADSGCGQYVHGSCIECWTLVFEVEKECYKQALHRGTHPVMLRRVSRVSMSIYYKAILEAFSIMPCNLISSADHVLYHCDVSLAPS